MKIGTRLVIALAAPLMLLMAVGGFLSQQRNRLLLRSELAKEGRAIARTVQFTVEDAIRDDQLENTRELVDRISGFERVLGLRIFSRDAEILYQTPSLVAHPFTQSDALTEVLATRQPVETQRLIGEQPVMTYIVPVTRSDGDLFGAVQVIQLQSFIEEDARRSRNEIALLTVVTIFAATGIVLLVTRLGVGRPVEALASRFREVGSGHLGARVPVKRNDELGMLAAEFNRMCGRLEEAQRTLLQEQEERLRVEARLRESERLAGLGQLAAGLAHEIGTPLNVIGGRAESLQRKLADSEVAWKNLGIITAQIDRISRIVRNMLDFARAREPKLVPTAIATVLRDVTELMEERVAAKNATVTIDAHEDVPKVLADPDRLQQAFLNLVGNALDALPVGGSIRIAAERVERASPVDGGRPVSWLAVAFQDTGPGISQKILRRVFDPFFTTKDVGKGTGLGLSVVYGIAREHGGWVEADSRPGEGALFTFYLPLEPAPERSAP